MSRKKLAKKEEGISRRTFLRRAGLVGAGLALAGTGVGIYLANRKNEWAFLDVDPFDGQNIKDDSYEAIKAKYPLIFERELPADSQDSQKAKAILMPEIQKIIEERKLTGKLTATPRKQIYLIPETRTDVIDSCWSYCKNADDFLHDQVKGLLEQRVDWVVSPEKNLESTRGKGFVGKGHHRVVEVTLTQDDSGEILERFGVFNKYANRGGTAQVNSDGWVIAVSANYSALISPFSEMIPLSMNDVRSRHAKEFGHERADMAVEAASEAMAVTLAKKLIDRLNISNGATLIEKASERAYEGKEIYRAVPQALSWTEKNGLQATFDSYMESPEKFMKEIGVD